MLLDLRDLLCNGPSPTDLKKHLARLASSQNLLYLFWNKLKQERSLQVQQLFKEKGDLSVMNEYSLRTEADACLVRTCC
uniref:Uncharacterized protein n=1 Tax=Salix viminalis TaxID=40686 RepID=A0A6N2LRT6_SALVM